MREYRHHAKYYETDQMGIIHHSNYIRWMEEARIDVMNQMGFGYKKMEELGIISPVLTVQCAYKNMVYFDDVVTIRTKIKSYNGIKLVVEYEFFDETTGQLTNTGESSHCFLDRNGKLISLRKVCPECDEAFVKWMEEDQ